MAQPTLQFQNFTQRDGLTSDYVLSILEDHRGLIWIGTENGLNRFDGQHFLRFHSDPKDPQSLYDNWISGLFEDSHHNLWVSTVFGLNRLDLETGKMERVPLLHDGQPVVTSVNNVVEGPTGDLWVVTPFSGLFKLAPPQNGQPWQAEHFSYENSHNWNKGGPRLINIALATADELWLVHSSGIDKLQLPSGQTTYIPIPVESQIRDNEQDPVGGLFDGRHKIFMGLNQELYLLDITKDQPEFQSFELTAFALDQGINITMDFLMDSPQTLLIPFYKNLALLDLKDGTYQLIKRGGQLGEDLFLNPIHALFKDERGNYWIGTSGGGLYLGQQEKDPFTLYRHDPSNPRSISEGQVRSLLEDDHGHLWVGILNHGLDQLIRQEDGTWQRNTTLTTAFDQPNSSLSDRVIKIIPGEGQSIWIATNNGGLMHVDSTGNLLASYTHQPNDPASLSGNRIWGLARDQNGYIWAGTWQDGLNRLDPRTGLVKRFRHDPADPGTLGNDHIRYLYFDRQDILWIGTHDGLGRYDPQTGRFTHYRHDPDDTLSLSNNVVWAICEDQEEQLWVGTNTGLNRFDPGTQTFTRYFEQDGLPDNTIYGILEDDEGQLWVSTENGLARKLPGNPARVFLPINYDNGLEMVSFSPQAFLNGAHSEELFFGGTQGLLVVNPSRMEQDSSAPRLVLHALTRFSRKAGTVEGVTDYFLAGESGPVRLGYQDQSVVLTLADLNRLNNNYYEYEYQLEGFHQHWIPLPQDMQITFTNLPPGNYRLRARAKNLDDTYVEAVELLRLRVAPPWWDSWWAYLIYVLFIGAVIGAFVRSHLRRQLAKKEAENLRTLDEFKNKLFANITHEFRTPLTIISGMIEQIRKKPDRWLEDGSAMIQRNTNNLLDLVNQILELQKVEASKLEVRLQQGDIIPFLQAIFKQFQAFGKSKEQQLTFTAGPTELHMDYDPEKTLRIVSNLLSNAIKYTPEKGQVHFSAALGEEPGLRPNRCLVISIQDTGPGIPKEQLPYIFDRFFQAPAYGKGTESGTGIGLSLTLELVKLLGGKIEVNSQVGQGTAFTVFLPITRKAAPAPAQGPAVIQGAIFGRKGLRERKQEPAADLPLALIVEDNPDIARYLQICLEGHYHVTVAVDGQAGVDHALERIPDIILSDVMMPKKDGFELCETLKEDIRTSHIPIILLTAKSDIESRLAGLKQGADDYLAKPFHEEELLVRMQNLLDMRRKLQERYQNFYTHLPAGQKDELPSKEDAFILKLKEIVEAHIDDPDFNLDALSQALFLSRSQLGRKVKALTGNSPALFLRLLRLQKARHLLLTTTIPVKEVGYKVGLSNPTYFSRSYTEAFGESPSNTRQTGYMRK
ncbi:MAG: response regulator [Lewinellaceae bacterium]|nr:response regulator [Lewinellaceae bacterium]